ncbi:MAG: hypothetical protein ACXADH_10805, partial [Candidatus Kariarchaeaceae archaeon]
VIFNQVQVGNYTTDWLVANWDTTLFNGENTIDIRVTDEAGNVRTHIFTTGFTGFNLRIDIQGPTIYSIEIHGDEPGISDSTLYDWDGSDFYLSFIFNSSSKITNIYIKSDQNSVEQNFDNSTWYWYNAIDSVFYNTSNTLISYDIGDTGNRSIFVRAYNLAGINSSWIEVNLFVDEVNPTVDLLSIVEGSSWNWTILADTANNQLYYSTLMGSNQAGFDITITADDTGSGMSGGYVSFETFSGQPAQIDTYTGSFYVTDTTSDGIWISATAYDASNRSQTYNIVQVIRDTTAPSNITIDSLVENSEHIFYDLTTLYYSNDQTMSDPFTITVLAQDNVGGAGLFNLTGSLAFSEQPADLTFDSGFSISYIIDQGDPAGSSITFSVYDLVGNVNNALSLSLELDNDNPSTPVITSIDENSEYLYYDGSSTLFYSNDQSMSDVFTIHFTTTDSGADLLNTTGSTDFGGETPFDNIYTTEYTLSYTINDGENAGGDNQIIITVYDRVGNYITKLLDCTVDNDGPISTDINDVIVLGGAQNLYYDSVGETFYYSNDQSMAESFTVQITAIDSLSGRQKANASEFGASVTTTTYGGNGFELTFTVNQGETAPTFDIIVWDNVGNPTPIGLTTVVDNISPTNPIILAIIESSNYLYNLGTTNLFYSNDQSMSDSFTIRITTSDSLSGLQKATGSSDFGGEIPEDLSYTSMYEISYTVDQSDTAGGDNQVIIVVMDNVGNTVSINLSCVLDNVSPTSPSVIGVVESSSHLFYDGSDFFYSNDQSMGDPFTIRLITSDTLSGLQKATGSPEFGGETPEDLVYTSMYEISYTVNQSDTAGGDNQVIITVSDWVGNTIQVVMSAYSDNTAPTVDPVGVLESSDYTYYNGTGILWYGNQMSTGKNVQFTITTSDGGQFDDSGVQTVEFPFFFNRGVDFNDTSFPYTLSYTIFSTTTDSGNMVFRSID